MNTTKTFSYKVTITFLVPKQIPFLIQSRLLKPFIYNNLYFQTTFNVHFLQKYIYFVDQYITGFVLEFLLLFRGVELLPPVSVQPSYVHVLDTLFAVRDDRSSRLAAAPRPGEQTLNLKQPATQSYKLMCDNSRLLQTHIVAKLALLSTSYSHHFTISFYIYIM